MNTLTHSSMLTSKIVIRNMQLAACNQSREVQKTKKFSTCWMEFEFQTSELHAYIYMEHELESKKSSQDGGNW